MIIDLSNNNFNLPIFFIEDKQELEKHIITDLELNETEKTKSLYDYVFLPQNKTDISNNNNISWGNQTIRLWSKYYTANKEFMRDSQKLLLADADEDSKKDSKNIIKYKDVLDIWQEIQEETGFIYKYQYIEYEKFESFNNNSSFLQCLSVFNMTSPVISLILPILFLIVPFIVLKIQGIPLTATMYISTLKTVFQKHHIGQLFLLNNASWDKVIYIIMSFAFYMFQIYQNIMSCLKFFKNMTKIHTQLFTIRDYLTETLEKMKKIEKQSEDLNLRTYKPFIRDMNEKAKIVKEMIDEYNKIIPFTTLFSIKKVVQVGHIMKCFYQLYNKQEYKDVLEYTFGFNGYLENLEGLKENIDMDNVGKWQDQAKQQQEQEQKQKKKNKHKTQTHQTHSHCADAKFKNAYFPSLINSNPVKNSYELNKHMIITGPNAAGKTTLLKTTIFNIILSQQTGFGFYESAEFEPYDMIHCYINIPDTSGRDSLFQAEARRCKEILDKVMDNNKDKKQRHFCVFDELYSGTNPYEAIGSAYAYLTFLNKYSNVNFVLTTHFLDLCKRVRVSPLKDDNKDDNKDEKSDDETLDDGETLDDDKSSLRGETLDDKSSLSGETLIKNYHMRINTDDADNFKYTYKLEKGISNIKGGVKVLKDLNYPSEIIESMNKVLKDINTF